MKYASYVTIGCLVVALGWLGWKQYQLAGELALLRQRRPATLALPKPESSTAALEDLRGRFEKTRIDLSAALHGISQTSSKLDSLQKIVEALNRQMQSMIATQQTNVAPNPSRKETKLVTIEEVSKPKPRRNIIHRRWGPEQATGAPDTMEAGDNASAWAPRNPHSGVQWLEVEYEKPVEIAMVKVRETFNPGAVCKITALDVNNKEIKVWEGVEPPTKPPAEMTFPASCRVQADRLRIYLDTNRVAGWNEIDAVELVGRDGTRQWAIDATASSSYAER